MEKETVTASRSPRPPSVGVVIPCFNQGRFARESVESVVAQDYGDVRAVLLDDASTDGVSQRLCLELEGPRIHVVVLEKNLGRALIRNRGFAELGTVDYILMLDCDDRLSSEYVRLLVEALEANPNAGLAYGTLHKFGFEDGKPASGSWPTRAWSEARMYLENVVPGPGTMFRREALLATEGWRAAFTRTSGEDFDISLQVLEKGWRPVWVEGAVFHYRKHDASFLASQSDLTRRLLDLNILRYHREGIRGTCGIRSFLEGGLLPFVLGGIRRRNWHVVRALLPPLLRLCPGETLQALSAYYRGRLAHR